MDRPPLCSVVYEGRLSRLHLCLLWVVLLGASVHVRLPESPRESPCESPPGSPCESPLSCSRAGT